VGDNLLDLLDDRPEHRVSVKKHWSRALAGEEFTVVDEFGDPNLDRRFYETKFNSLRDRNGELVGAFQFVYDVTDRGSRSSSPCGSRGASPAGAKNRCARPIDGGRRARLQQSADGHLRGPELIERCTDAQRRERIIAGMRQLPNGVPR